MNTARLNLLKKYIELGVSPLLIENLPSNFFNNTVIIKSNVDKSELNGHYENINFCPPLWYQQLLEKSKNNQVVLLIEDINKINIEEQTKFIEILKYNKISTFELPKNCLIIATCSDLKADQINENVYSLFAHI